MPLPEAQRNSSRQHRRRVYASETVGLVLIALFVLVLILVRYWHNIHWSLR